MINSPSGHVIPMHFPTASPAAVSLPVALSAIPQVVTTGASPAVVVVSKSNINSPATSTVSYLVSTASTATSVSTISSNGTVRGNTVSAPASSSGIAITTKEVFTIRSGDVVS
jgi:hypothetical protein